MGWASAHSIRQAVFPAPELLLGMGLAQVIATLQVYVSNLRLFANMTAVAAAGFLPVPNQLVLPRLLEVRTAFWGGLLFTLSVGVALTLLSIAAAWVWRRLLPPRRYSILVLAGLLAASLLFMNSRGADLWVSLYFIAIPPPVFWMTRRTLSRPVNPPDRQILMGRMLPLAVLALAWTTQFDSGLFIDLRDHLLMSNAAGEKISSFYYRYTLYPAEVFKPLDQRLIRTVAWTDADPGFSRVELARELIRHDYLPLPHRGEADLGLRSEPDRLAFIHEGAPVLETTWERFRAQPRQVLAELSTRTDRWSRFRAVCFYGVLLAFPVTLYFLLFASLRVLNGTLAGARRAEALSAAACLLIGLGFLVWFHLSREAASHPGDFAEALTSNTWQQRVAALKAIPEQGLDICSFPGYSNLLGSPEPQERYWLGRALAASPNPAASAALLRLLDDPHINVRTMALEGLAARQERAAAKPILKRLKASKDWYDQMYAYKALRALGWIQTRSR